VNDEDCEAHTLSEQDGTQKITLQQQLANDNVRAWNAYWEAQGQPWRVAPEISKKRQTYLAEHRKIEYDIDQGIYPFKDLVFRLPKFRPN
jgi:hypothetical protein